MTKTFKTIVPGREPHIAPGVRGYTVEDRGVLYVPLVIADRPDSGDVARFLDGLPRDRTVKFPSVLSGVLAGMLARRGFMATVEYVPECGWIEVWERGWIEVWER